MKKGIISAGHQKTAEAGANILRNGGNAFDALLAAFMTSFVTESASISAAGSGFLMAQSYNNDPVLYDFFSQTPKKAKAFDDIDFRPILIQFPNTSQKFQIGLGTMAIPGNLAGLAKIHTDLGSMPLSEIAQPAIEAAKNGCDIDKFQEQLIYLLEPVLNDNKLLRQLFIKENGERKQSGDTIHIPYLADCLDYFSRAGIREFYEGEIAQKIANDCSEKGGLITLEDLAAYKVIKRKPIHFPVNGFEVISNPCPSSGGLLASYGLKLLNAWETNYPEWGTPAYVEMIATILSKTQQARTQIIDQNLHHPQLANHVLFDQALTAPLNKNSSPNSSKMGNTTHISVIDKKGNAASLTHSAGEGSGYFIPGTGIFMNNMLGEADLLPNGFHNWPTDQRMSSMMAPTLIRKNGIVQTALGTGGSKRIRSVILQSIINECIYNKSPKASIELPRIHLEDNILQVEPGFDLPESTIVTGIKVNEWNEQHMYYGGVNIVQTLLNGKSEGVGDHRRHGVVVEV